MLAVEYVLMEEPFASPIIMLEDLGESWLKQAANDALAVLDQIVDGEAVVLERLVVEVNDKGPSFPNDAMRCSCELRKQRTPGTVRQLIGQGVAGQVTSRVLYLQGLWGGRWS